MSNCTIKTKTIDFLKKEGVMTAAREVTDYGKFEKLNRQLTNRALRKYNVGGNNNLLFTTELTKTARLDGSYRNLIRAIPNDELFNLLDEAVPISEEVVVKELFQIQQPTISFSSLSVQDLVNSDNPTTLKKAQDAFTKKVDEMNNLINCLWTS